jgi:hypothetical protein
VYDLREPKNEKPMAARAAKVIQVHRGVRHQRRKHFVGLLLLVDGRYAANPNCPRAILVLMGRQKVRPAFAVGQATDCEDSEIDPVIRLPETSKGISFRLTHVLRVPYRGMSLPRLQQSPDHVSCLVSFHASEFRLGKGFSIA